MKRLLRGGRNEQGELMIEASFILVSVILLLMALLSLTFFFYQKALMTNVANEIAADVAKNYKYTSKEVGESDIKLSDIESSDGKRTIKMFRMNFGKMGMEDAHEMRAESYAKWRINLATLGINSNDVDVDCQIVNSGIGRAYVRVTVSQKTEFFLSSILELAGITEKNALFESTAYAECVDLMGYTSMVNFTKYGSKRLAETFGPIGELYVSVKGFIQELAD